MTTSALRRSAVPNVIEGEWSSTSQRDEDALGELYAHVRLTRARGDVPVDQAHVVADLVRADLSELAATPEQRRTVVAGEQPVDTSADRELERPQERVGHRPGTGLVRRRRDAQRGDAPAHAAAGRPRSSCGWGTAASTTSSTSSADRSSASAWYVSTSRWRNASLTSAWTSCGEHVVAPVHEGQRPSALHERDRPARARAVRDQRARSRPGRSEPGSWSPRPGSPRSSRATGRRRPPARPPAAHAAGRGSAPPAPLRRPRASDARP